MAPVATANTGYWMTPRGLSVDRWASKFGPREAGFARVRGRVAPGMTTHPHQDASNEADPHPHQAASDEADPEKQSSPAGVVKDLEEEAEEIGASTDPLAPHDEQPTLP